MPDFCPAISRSRLPALTSSADDPKSKSGPFSVGQFGVRSPQAELYASLAVICRDHAICPVLRSSAMTASLVLVAGVE